LSWFICSTGERADEALVAGVRCCTCKQHFQLADTPVSPAEAEKIKAALKVIGCTGGKMEKETEGSGYFELDDAKCNDGQYDIKLDKDFKMIAMTRD
jgi:hypothetical protein